MQLQDGDTAHATEVFSRSLELSRDAARDLRLLCDDLEPRVLHQLGFASAVAALARRISARHDVRIDVDVEAAAATLGENAAVALYQIVREATEQAVRRGTLTRVVISLNEADSGGVELMVEDDGPPERRAAVLEGLADRAATLNGRFSSDIRDPRGLTLKITVPPATAHR
jgi:two-component system, NarL family, sensor histidine kinase UhpB